MLELYSVQKIIGTHILRSFLKIISFRFDHACKKLETIDKFLKKGLVGFFPPTTRQLMLRDDGVKCCVQSVSLQFYSI